MWGESNTRNFVDWADYCQSNSLKNRSINSTGGYDYKSNINSDVTRKAMIDVLSLIKNNKSLSVQHFYNTAPPIYVANPTTKYLLLQLYYQDCIKLKGEVDNSTFKEKNYTMVFSKNLSTSQPQPIRNNYEKQNSNIESMIDNNWVATGRKLEFDKKEREVKREYNINLKNNNSKTTTRPAVKPVIQSQKQPILEETKQVVPASVFEKPDIKVEEPAPSFNYFSLPKPEVKEDIKISEVTLNLTELPKQREKEVIVDNKIFAGLNSYELYFIHNFLRDSINRGIDSSSENVKLSKIVVTRAEMAYLKEGNGVNIASKIAVIFFSFLIIGLFFIGLAFKNKQKANAKKDYFKQIKDFSYKKINEDLNLKYPNIIKKIY
ncbi:hypothetical protein SLITO_v1c10570 [Spiroplasma litorale]|uniref:Uncharacterized protein n=1 Tax=Spiroplasma litorale TaxID=216942 RepID=A0A0K1W3B0_9MOLU|nr:hypothetical protein [Spiroplasma litorale]AKX34668.1 hypothetical protein SLITO_v1c10570 [Spiroplasma litorale]